MAYQHIRPSVFIQQKRFRGKINIQKPRPPHEVRRRVEQFVTPFVPNPATNLPLWERCTQKPNLNQEKKPDHPYEVILARECLNWFETSKLIAFVHANSIIGRDLFDFRVLLKKANMYLKRYHSSILKIALGGTRYEPLMHFTDARCPTYIVFGSETNSATLNKIVKKTPEMVLLGKYFLKKFFFFSILFVFN